MTFAEQLKELQSAISSASTQVRCFFPVVFVKRYTVNKIIQ